MAAVTSNANQQLQSILIFFKFVYLCLLLCLLSSLYLLYIVSGYFCFSQYVGGFIRLNFDKFRVTAPFIKHSTH